MPAKSKSQQRLMGMVYAYKDGKLDLDKLPKSLADKIKGIADGERRKTGDKRKKTKGMTKTDAKKYASTKHKGLPEKVEERIITKFNDFIKESHYFLDKFFTGDKWDEIVDNDNIVIEAFKKRGLSCDEKENYYNDIYFDNVNGEIVVNFTSYALGGELPNNISKIMEDISEELGAESWHFWDPMGKVIFKYEGTTQNI